MGENVDREEMERGKRSLFLERKDRKELKVRLRPRASCRLWPNP